MAIYTKTGDKGETSLFGGKRLLKSDERIEAYGTIDELTSHLGLLILKVKEPEKQLLIGIQKDLYTMMALLAGAEQNLESFTQTIEKFERAIDSWEQELPKLTRFILPGGTEDAAVCHICRAVCRRAERSVVRYVNSTDIKGVELIIKYLNRLSDLLFVLARKIAGGKETVT